MDPEEKDLNKNIEEMVLLLIYLTSWEEKVFDTKVLGSWKGYPFEILDELKSKDLISGSRKAKSIYLTDAGIKKAKNLLNKYIESKQAIKKTCCVI